MSDSGAGEIVRLSGNEAFYLESDWRSEPREDRREAFLRSIPTTEFNVALMQDG